MLNETNDRGGHMYTDRSQGRGKTGSYHCLGAGAFTLAIYVEMDVTASRCEL